jgi:hypothetical protein
MATGWDREPQSAANSMALLGITAWSFSLLCTNLANLLLARAAARRSEIACGWRWARAVGGSAATLTESLLLAGLGGGLGWRLRSQRAPQVLPARDGATIRT